MSTRSSALLGVLVGILAVLAVALVPGCSRGSSSATDRVTGIPGVVTYSDLKRDHVQPPVSYPQSPPVGGPHVSTWAACDGRVYDAPLKNEEAVHSLEHGAVWITYDQSLSADQIAALAAKVDGTNYRLMSPYPEQKSPVVLTGWGVQLALDDPADPRVDQFLAKYTNGPQTPEPGATCANPTQMAQKV